MNIIKTIVLTIITIFFIIAVIFKLTYNPKFEISDPNKYFETFIKSNNAFPNDTIYFDITTHEYYDDKTKTLLLTGGYLPSEDPYLGYDSTPILFLHNSSRFLESYYATNAFGVKVRVKEFLEEEYAINLSNLEEIPSEITYEECFEKHLVLSKKIPQYKIDKSITSVSLIVGVIPRSSQYASCTEEISNATLDNPQKITLRKYSIEAKFVGIWLYNKNTNEILTEYIIP